MDMGFGFNHTTYHSARTALLYGNVSNHKQNNPPILLHPLFNRRVDLLRIKFRLKVMKNNGMIEACFEEQMKDALRKDRMRVDKGF